MRPRLPFLLICSMFCIGGFAQKPISNTDLARLDLRGNVKSVRQIPHKTDEGFKDIVIGKKWPYTEDNTYTIFNEYGNMIEKILFNENNKHYARKLFKYDSTGNMIKEILYNSSGRFTSVITYEYDGSGNIIESKYDSNLGIKYIYKYDDNGNRIKEKKYFGNANLYFTANYEYDHKGNMTQVAVFTSGGKPFSRWTFTYDNTGNMIEKKRYIANNNFFCKISYEYGEDGSRVVWRSYNSNGKLDCKGVYGYEHDNKGNWITKTMLKDNEPAYVLKREIQYFENEEVVEGP